jgi:hypothetical protein
MTGAFFHTPLHSMTKETGGWEHSFGVHQGCA